MSNFGWLTPASQIIHYIALLFSNTRSASNRANKTPGIPDSRSTSRTPTSIILSALCVALAQVAVAQTSCPITVTGGEAGGMTCPSGLPTDTMTDYVQACLNVLAASQIASGEFSSVSYTPSCNPGGPPAAPGVSCPVAVSATWGSNGAAWGHPGCPADPSCSFTATGEASVSVSQPPCSLDWVTAPSSR